ncbi:MAG: glycosyltransferase [Polyangiaceae bacterium]
MHIVHVVLSLGLGGQEVLILELCRELARRGERVTVICLTEGGALRGEFGEIPVVEMPRRGGVDIALLARLWRRLRGERADVVHTHNTAPLVYGAPAGRLARVGRVIHTKHGSRAGGRRTLLLARGASRLVDAFVAVSPATAEVARQAEHAPSDRLTVIPNGIPVERYRRDAAARARVRAELGIPGEAVVIASVGRFVEDKDYPLLVRAASPLLGDGLRLLVVGDGPTLEQVRAAVPERARPFVVLPGQRRDVPDVLSACDVFALSSRTEGLPIALIEAMAAGLPVVATAVGGLPTTVPDDAGVLVRYGDAAALGAALGAMAGDADRRRRMGEAATRAAADRYSVARMTDAYLSLYRGDAPEVSCPSR